MARKNIPIQKEIVEILKLQNGMSSKDVHEHLNTLVAYATLKRTLVSMVKEDQVVKYGRGKATLYALNPSFELLSTVDLDTYYSVPDDEREIIPQFNFDLLDALFAEDYFFTSSELLELEQKHSQFLKRIQSLELPQYKTEFERLAIDLSWKSSQIEGNTYSLLETELLLKQQLTAAGKTKDEAVMLLNHKNALDFLLDHPYYIHPLRVTAIEEVHSLLTHELNVKRNIRNRRVGISGTLYRPLDNEYQIREALQKMCDLINQRQNIWEKALLALLLISYIQPFDDGNKRTARIVSNALMMYNHYCPLSFRTIDPIEYKKALLLFYERNNISAFKRVFIEQYQYAVEHYF
jgi:prophage maintenance system killer protein